MTDSLKRLTSSIANKPLSFTSPIMSCRGLSARRSRVAVPLTVADAPLVVVASADVVVVVVAVAV